MEGREEHVTAHPGCGLGENVTLCLLFTVLTVMCPSGCHPSLHCVKVEEHVRN